MEELTPRERHGRVVRHIREDLGWVESAHLREAVLCFSALLEIAERHAPCTRIASEPGWCKCSFGWPCADFLSCEKILAKPSPSE